MPLIDALKQTTHAIHENFPVARATLQVKKAKSNTGRIDPELLGITIDENADLRVNVRYAQSPVRPVHFIFKMIVCSFFSLFSLFKAAGSRVQLVFNWFCLNSKLTSMSRVKKPVWLISSQFKIGVFNALSKILCSFSDLVIPLNYASLQDRLPCLEPQCQASRGLFSRCLDNSSLMFINALSVIL